MAAKKLSIYVGRELFAQGSCVNVYDTYAHALAHASTGLATVNSADKLTGASSTLISQAAKTVGVAVDRDGMINFYIDDAGTDCYLMADGIFGAPRRVKIQ